MQHMQFTEDDDRPFQISKGEKYKNDYDMEGFKVKRKMK